MFCHKPSLAIFIQYNIDINITNILVTLFFYCNLTVMNNLFQILEEFIWKILMLERTDFEGIEITKINPCLKIIFQK